MKNRKVWLSPVVVGLTFFAVGSCQAQRTTESYPSSRTLAVPGYATEGPVVNTAPASLQTARSASLNDLVLAAVKSMPQGGRYATDRRAFVALNQAVGTGPGGGLELHPEAARPVFCSGATYLVLLKVIDRLNQEGRLPLSREVVAALQVRSLPDGEGVWGRWNANGPGTARLFREAQLGENFTSFEDGKPGDFMKIWWNDNIGASERGHSVVYLGTSVSAKGEDMVDFWSGNVPDGMGFKSVPRSRVRRVLFSRFENPRALSQILEIPRRDDYLAGLLKRNTTEEEMCTMVGAARLGAAARR